MAVVIAIGMLLGLFVGGVTVEARTMWFWTAADIPDATRPAAVRLSYGGWSRPNGVIVRVTGNIDGEAEVWGRHPDWNSGWDRVKLSGDVNYEGYHDWFTSDLDFHYQPVLVRGGHLTVQYRFPH